MNKIFKKKKAVYIYRQKENKEQKLNLKMQKRLQLDQAP